MKQSCADCGALAGPRSSRSRQRCWPCYCRMRSVSAQPTHGLHKQIRELFDEGLTLSTIARRLGVTKNTISGYCDRQGWHRGHGCQYSGPTTLDRLDALEARMDAVLSEFISYRDAGKLYRPATKLDEAA